MENAIVVGFRVPSKRKFVPRPLTSKLGDLARFSQAQKARRPIEKALDFALANINEIGLVPKSWIVVEV